MAEQEIAQPIVGIGASAGGLEAFRGFFENMPPDSGLAFVVVLHLPPDRKSILAEILGRWAAMPVIEAVNGCRVDANHIYVPPPGVVVTVRAHRLQFHRADADEPRELNPISMLFNALAEDLGEDAIGIVLSGTGSDGALGLKAIKEKGGLTLAQGSDGIPPQHDGMPSSAIATGAVDIITSAELMPQRIIAIHDARRQATRSAAPTNDNLEAARLAICAVLHRQLGHDFSGYKDKTFMRRVQRRMDVLELTTFPLFLERLESDRHEVVMLFRDLLIGVTSFFRDEETFALLKTDVVPRLFAGKTADSTIRIWVPGCATGEEAYSLAILMREHLDSLDGAKPKVLIFATDIDEPAIATARSGRYPSTLLQGLSSDRLSRFFVHGIDGSYTIEKSIRELCTFSTHSLIRDPPFSRITLLSCRNLLIYLDIELQAIAIPAFHYSLVTDGILLLGSSETVNRHEALFTTLDRSHRIFQKRDVPSPPLRVAGRVSPREGEPVSPSAAEPHVVSGRNLRTSNWAHSRILEAFAPPFVVVTARGEAVQYSANLGAFLELAPGMPSRDITLMARTGLRAPLRAAIREAVESGRTVEKSAIPVRAADGQLRRCDLFVEPKREQGPDRLLLVVFRARSDALAGDHADENAADSNTDGLEAELRDTRDQLHSITEEHDTALEELRSSNEELHSVNEELQSTNEELETSKEEIQSINEELQTVIGQLASKVDELDRKNSDLRNLFESTQVATIFLDPYMIVRSFTPAIASIYNLIPSDHGRPITDIVSQLDYKGLREDCRSVLQTLKPVESRVGRIDQTAHYLMRILPYRTPESQVDGTIVTFVDVTNIVQAEQHQRLLVDELNHRVKNMLTVVISLAGQTLRRSGTLAEFEKNYMGRIHALTAAYSLLSDQGWQMVSLRALVHDELKPFLFADSANVTVAGPTVPLPPRSALALGMALHELTTNAVKYGALSVPEGTVQVTWHIEPMQDGTLLALEWVESGGPSVARPSHRGFGMTLIERGLSQDMSAQVDIQFAPDGVRARILAPLPDISAPDAGGRQLG